jgi:hypothetical protein
VIWTFVFWLSLAGSLAVGFVYFRDLGDVSQMVLKVKRANMIRFIRNEYRFLAVGLAAGIVMVLTHLISGAGSDWAFWTGLVLIVFLYGFPWVWVHVGLRNQKNDAKYFSVEEAAKFVGPSNSVMVIENDGVARAHPDAELMRPHLAGNAQGLAGENVVMTYCAMANLGVGYTPDIAGEKLDLEVLAQHGNNLILRDNTTGEPIQHIYGRREGDGPDGQTMRPWPTFRMTFRGYCKAYPQGQVFLNKPSGNLLLRVFDMFTDTVFSAGIAQQHRAAAPVMDNMSHYDNRLPNKTYVWGVNIGADAVCYTDDFVIANGPVNTVVGGRAIVLAYAPEYESLGAWFNDSGTPVQRVDFFGESDQGRLTRVDALKAGLFWHVWVQFFPHTDVNRVGAVASAKNDIANEGASS